MAGMPDETAGRGGRGGFRFLTTGPGIQIERDPIAVVAVGGGGGGGGGDGVIGRVEYQEASRSGDGDCAINAARGEGRSIVDAGGGGGETQSDSEHKYESVHATHLSSPSTSTSPLSSSSTFDEDRLKDEK